MIEGIDISYYQGTPDYDTLKNNISFVIFKATEGVGYTDAQFKRNQSEARRVGLPLGYYHFCRPDLGNTPEAEADWFLSVINPPLVGEMLFLDFEVPYGKAITWCKSWLDRVYQVTGCKPLIYLNQSQLKLGWKSVIDADYGLWLAAYLTYCPETQWPVVAFQQTSSSGTVPGISGRVDTNVFFGEKEDLKSYGVGETGGDDMDECEFEVTDPEDGETKQKTGQWLADEWENEKAEKIECQEDLAVATKNVQTLMGAHSALADQLKETQEQVNGLTTEVATVKSRNLFLLDEIERLKSNGVALKDTPTKVIINELWARFIDSWRV